MPTEAEIRNGNLNVIGTMRHAVRCAHVADRAAMCDCNPLDDSKAMTSVDVLRVFAPLPRDAGRFLSWLFAEGRSKSPF